MAYNGTGMSEAVVLDSMLASPGSVYASVNVSDFKGIPSILVRFNGNDPSLGPGADTFMGYECRFVLPGGGSKKMFTAGIGFHNHMYTSLVDAPTQIPIPSRKGEAVAFRVEVDQPLKGGAVTFKLYIDGACVLTYTDRNQTRHNSVDGSQLALRAFQGMVTFNNLKFGVIEPIAI